MISKRKIEIFTPLHRRNSCPPRTMPFNKIHSNRPNYHLLILSNLIAGFYLSVV